MFNKNAMFDAINDPERVASIQQRNAKRKHKHIKVYDYKDHIEIPTSIIDFVETCSSKAIHEVDIEEINLFLNSYDEWCIDKTIKNVKDKYR